MAEKMIQARVHKNQVQGKISQGWRPVQGKGAAGVIGGGDSILMEIPEDKFLELKKQTRAPFEKLYESMELGKMDLGEGRLVEVISGGKAKFDVEEIRED